MSNSHNHYKQFIACMLQLNDETFINLTQNYLGQPSSSFNRTKISEELAHFLLQEEVLAAIKKNLEQTDLEYLSLITYDNRADFELFQAFFIASREDQIGWRLNNLAERLLIFYNPKSSIYCLNPLFSTIFKPLNLGFSYLFGHLGKTTSTKPLWFSANQLSGYLAIRQHQHSPQVIIASNLNLSELELVILDRALGRLSIIHQGGIDKSRLEDFSQLSFVLQVAYLAAAYCSDRVAEQEIITMVIQHLFHNYSHKIINLQLIGRLYYLYAHHVMPPRLLQQLEAFKIWQRDSNTVILKEPSPTVKDSIYIEADSSCYLMPGQPLRASIPLAFILEQYDIVSRYSITQESFFKALSVGYSAQSLINSLGEDGIVNLSQNFKTTLINWQELYESIQIFHGYIIKLSANKNRLVKNSQWLNQYIEREIGEGYYLLKAAPTKDFYMILEKIGGPLINKIIEPSATLATITIEPKVLQKNINPILIKALPSSSPLLSHANSEIQRRINRKIIFFDDQLNYLPRPLPSAQGFDFQGKLRLIKSAINEGLDLEIEIIKNNHLSMTHLKPLSLKKNSDIYILEALNYANNQIIRGSIESISSVTVVKPTLLH